MVRTGTARTPAVGHGAVVDDGGRQHLGEIGRVQGDVLDRHVHHSRDARACANRRHRTAIRRNAGVHDVDVLQERRRLVDDDVAVPRQRSRRVVELQTPPVILGRVLRCQAVAVQVNSLLMY